MSIFYTKNIFRYVFACVEMFTNVTLFYEVMDEKGWGSSDPDFSSSDDDADSGDSGPKSPSILI